MRVLFIILLLFGISSCAIRTFNVHVEKELSSGVFLGKGQGVYGVWGKVYLGLEDSTHETYSRLIFRSPDSVDVHDNYILLKRKKKYCLIFRSGTEKNADLVITRQRTKIEEMINRL